MEVKDILNNIVDHYIDVVIEVFDKESNSIQKYYIKPHVVSYNLPPEIMWARVGMIVLYKDSMNIAVVN